MDQSQGHSDSSIEGGRDIIQIPDVSERGTARIPQIRENVGSQVNAVAGDPIGRALSIIQARDALVTQDPQRSEVKVNNDALLSAQDQLRDIEDLAAELVQKNMEHRVKDFRDRLPIFGNYRSHQLATREGEIIDQLHQLVSDLQTLVGTQGLKLDLTELVESAITLEAPRGFTKALGTLLPSWRTFHRSWVTPRAEKIKSAASNLRRQTQDASRGEVRRAA